MNLLRQCLDNGTDVMVHLKSDDDIFHDVMNLPKTINAERDVLRVIWRHILPCNVKSQ